MDARANSVAYPTQDWRICGSALAAFLAITYVLCVVYDLIFPGQTMYTSWMKLLPGFTWLTWGNFILGLIEAIGYGYYIALVFCPLYNLFSRIFTRKALSAVGGSGGYGPK